MEQLFADILDHNLALGMLAGFAATTMQGYVGFGGGLIFIPLMTILFGPIEGIAVAGLAAFVGQLQVLPNAIRNANRQEVTPVMVGILIATPLGAVFLVSADPAFVKYAMGGFVLATAFLLMANVQYRGPRGRAPSLAVGLASGGITGAFGVPGGPVFGLYFMAATEPPPVKRANLMLSAWLMVTMLLVSLAVAGEIGAVTLARAVVVAPATIIGVAFGAYLFRMAPAAWFRHVVMWLLVVSGIAVIVA